MHPLVTEFMVLFDGYKDAHGIYQLPPSDDQDGKIKGKAYTIKQPLTVELYHQHLTGKQGLGVVPINSNSECKFAAIDVDVYPLDLGEINKKIQDLGLPLVPCRTKSGGCHIYLFLKEFTDAKIVQDRMREWAALLGFGSSEIYPIQTKVLVERGDVGQWINLPYFNAVATNRYAIGEKGTKLFVEQFVEYALSKMIDEKELRSLKIKTPDMLPGAPPCLQHLCSQGFPEGTRNNGLFALGVYAMKSNPDGWESDLEKYNAKFMQPPLASSDVQGVIKSLKKKEYNYNCHSQPIQSYCNIAKCRKCQFGVGESSGMPTLGTLTKLCTAPPIWFVDVESGVRLELSTEGLQSPVLFQKACMEQLNMMPLISKRDNWTMIVAKLMETVNVIEAPVEATPQGQLIQYLEDFLTSRVQAKSPDELLIGKPWTNNGEHFFRLKDFLKYLERQKFTDLKMNRIAMFLRDHGAEKHFFNLKGKGVNCFRIKEFQKQTQSFETPKTTQDIPY